MFVQEFSSGKIYVPFFILTSYNRRKVILLIDCNENLEKMQELQRHLVSEPLFLTVPIRTKYDITGILPPTQENGSYPIAAIFVSQDVGDIVKGGWLKFGDGVGDHRPLYIDISIKTLLGKYKNMIYPHRIRRLQCNNTSTVQRYNSLLERHYDHHNTLSKRNEFHALRSDPVTYDDIARLQRIDKVRTSAVKFAEKNCRKLHSNECLVDVIYQVYVTYPLKIVRNYKHKHFNNTMHTLQSLTSTGTTFKTT